MSAEQAVSGLRDQWRPPPGRPYVVLNMIVTLDGEITIGGRSGPIGGRADRELFHGLRGQADAVLVGAGTVRNERYGRLVRSPERRALRAEAGLAPDPLAAVVSGRLDLPEDLPLLRDPDSAVVVLTREPERRLPPTPARVDYLRGDTDELSTMLASLRSDHGIETIVCEGGPKLNTTLLRGGLIDELYLSIAPKIAGGVGPRMLSPAQLAEPRAAELLGLLEADGTLFTRYRLR